MRNTFIFILFLAFSIFTYSQSETELTLQLAIDYALENNIRILNTSLDKEIAGNKIKELRGVALPQAKATLSFQDYLNIPTSLIPAEFFGGQPGTYTGVQFGTQYNSNGAVEVNQLAFDASYILGMKASKVYYELAQRNVSVTINEIVASVKKAYFTVLISQERLDLMRANMDNISRLMEETKVMYENGIVEKLDYTRLLVIHHNLQTDINKIERMVEVSMLLLKFQMNMPQQTAVLLVDSLTMYVNDGSFMVKEDILANYNYLNRMEFQLAQLQVKSAVLQHQSYKLKILPSAFLFGSFSKNAQRNEFNFFDSDEEWYPTSLVGLNIKIPVFDGLQSHFQSQQAKLSIAKAENTLEMVRQSIDLEVLTTSFNLTSAAESIVVQEQNVKLAEEVYEISALKYKNGVGSNMEVLNAETSLKEAQTNYYNAVFEALIAKIDYESALGLESEK